MPATMDDVKHPQTQRPSQEDLSSPAAKREAETPIDSVTTTTAAGEPGADKPDKTSKGERDPEIMIQSIVTCNVCKELLKQPVTLGCLHSFCHTCFRDAQDPKMEFASCPTCKEEVKGIPHADIRLSKMVKVFETRIPECANCFNQNATCICKTCNVSLCNGCWKTTHTARIFKDHEKVDVLRGPDGFEKCKDHPGNNAEFVCMDCNMIVCHSCILRGQHVNHTYHSVEVFRQNEDTRFEERIKLVQESRSKLLAAVEGVDRSMSKLHESHRVVSNQIANHFDVLESAIRERREALLGETSKIRDKHVRLLLEQKEEFQKSLDTMAESIGRARQIVGHSFDDDLSKSVDFVTERLKKVSMLPSTNPIICTKCDFKGVTCLCPRETGKMYATLDENLSGLIASYGVVDTRKQPSAYMRVVKTEHAQKIALGIQTAYGGSWGSNCSLM